MTAFVHASGSVAEVHDLCKNLFIVRVGEPQEPVYERSTEGGFDGQAGEARKMKTVEDASSLAAAP